MAHAEFIAGRAGSLVDAAFGLMHRGLSAFDLRCRRKKTIAALHAMSDRSLDDIGIDRSDIETAVYVRIAKGQDRVRF